MKSRVGDTALAAEMYCPLHDQRKSKSALRQDILWTLKKLQASFLWAEMFGQLDKEIIQFPYRDIYSVLLLLCSSNGRQIQRKTGRKVTAVGLVVQSRDTKDTEVCSSLPSHEHFLDCAEQQLEGSPVMEDVSLYTLDTLHSPRQNCLLSLNVGVFILNIQINTKHQLIQLKCLRLHRCIFPICRK